MPPRRPAQPGSTASTRRRVGRHCIVGARLPPLPPKRDTSKVQQGSRAALQVHPRAASASRRTLNVGCWRRTAMGMRASIKVVKVRTAKTEFAGSPRPRPGASLGQPLRERCRRDRPWVKALRADCRLNTRCTGLILQRGLHAPRRATASETSGWELCISSLLVTPVTHDFSGHHACTLSTLPFNTIPTAHFGL